jgi:hypothetical protein
MSYNFLRYDAGNIRTIGASDSHTNSSIYKGTGMSYFRQKKNCIPKLALEIRDLSLLATVLLPRLEDRAKYGPHFFKGFV